MTTNIANDIKKCDNSVVALGSFDGVHKGHQTVLTQAVKKARALGVSSVALCLLPPHPRELIEDDGLRGRHIEQLGIDICIQHEFLQYHTMSAEEFIDKVLIEQLGCKAVVCGEDFRFGHKRQGNIKTLAARNAFEIITPKRCDEDGDKISSTRIRQALKSGEIEKVTSMLGRSYCIDYVVKHGFGIGEKLGFPTINQYWPDGFVRPKSGVYITSVLVNGKVLPSATGVTRRPTFTDGMAVSCETTIAAEVGDLYGENVQLFFHKYLFEAKKFDDTKELAAMVADVCEQSKAYQGLMKQFNNL